MSPLLVEDDVGDVLLDVADRVPVSWDRRLPDAADTHARQLLEQVRCIELIGGRMPPGRAKTVHLAPGRVVGRRYRIDCLLGRGGMGEVWRVRDLKLGVDLALKGLGPDLIGDERALDRLRREVRCARGVVSPNVCRTFDIADLDGFEMLAMEFVDGETLHELLCRQGPLALPRALEIASQLLAGLEAIHRTGLVHRDVKPENIMVTRAGRVVLMDFGLARDWQSRKTMSMAGTPRYMAPEVLVGGRIDPRSDIFSVGVVLAGMIASPGSRDSIFEGVRLVPPRLPRSRWRPVLLRAIAQDQDDRYPSARAMLGALEQATWPLTLAPEQGEADPAAPRPYPGLPGFTASTAGYFFGREPEIEGLWKKLAVRQMVALIGPAGVGKSSLLRAGILPALPAGWAGVICSPGRRPYSALAEALAPQLTDELEVTRGLLHINEPDVAVNLVRRWRDRHEQALLIVDPFEDLFTLGTPELEASFADLLGRLSTEADVHVLLALRDEFLLRCHDHPALEPIFTELAPVRSLPTPALRRAIVQPALLCGYGFEDETLVDQILDGVAGSRDPLPQLAFAMARLWDERDRASCRLTHVGYERIGGVVGALARHAEETMGRIGSDRWPIVREIFRNLVDAERRPVSRGIDELHSLFGDEEREPARQVLEALRDAHLLAGWTGDRQGAGEGGELRIEIAHRALLAAWPRLAGWLEEDREGARLHDALRAAAVEWDRQDQPRPLLWRGSRLKEYLLWRERHDDRLTSIERAFADAMCRDGRLRQCIGRLAVAVTICVLLSAIGVAGVSWWNDHERQVIAVAAARRADALSLYAVARAELEPAPAASLAHVIASLELEDDPAVRRLAVEALWRQPAVFRDGLEDPFDHGWTDTRGEWLVYSRKAEVHFVRLSHPETPELVIQTGHRAEVKEVLFDTVGQRAATVDRDDEVRYWSLSDGEERERAPASAQGWRSAAPLWSSGSVNARVFRGHRRGVVEAVFRGDGQSIVSSAWDGTVRVWPLGGHAPRQVWKTAAPLTPHAVMDRGADRLFVGFSHALAFDRQRGVMAVAHAPWWIVPLDGSPVRTFVADGSPSTIRVCDLTSGGEIGVLVPPGDEAIDELRFLPGGALLSAGSGGLLMWDLESGSFKVLREGHVTRVAVAPDGKRVLSVGAISGAMVHDLTDGSVRPLASHGLLVTHAVFDATGSIVVSGDREGVLRVGPVTGEEPHLLFGHAGAITAVDVSSDSTRIVSSGVDSTLRVWSMPIGAPLHTFPLEKLLARLREAAAASTLGPADDPDPVRRSATDSWELDS